LLNFLLFCVHKILTIIFCAENELYFRPASNKDALCRSKLREAADFADKLRKQKYGFITPFSALYFSKSRAL